MTLENAKEQSDQGVLGQLLAKGKLSCYPHKQNGMTCVKMQIDIGTDAYSVRLANAFQYSFRVTLARCINAGDETRNLAVTIWGALAVAVNNRLQVKNMYMQTQSLHLH